MSPDEIEHATALRRDRLPWAEIARAVYYGGSWTQCAVLRAHPELRGILPPSRLRAAHLALAYALVLDNRSYSEVAKLLGCHRSSLRYRLRSLYGEMPRGKQTRVVQAAALRAAGRTWSEIARELHYKSADSCAQSVHRWRRRRARTDTREHQKEGAP